MYKALYCVFLILVACNQNNKPKTEVGGVSQFSVEDSLINNPVFADLDKQNEVMDMFDMDTAKKRTSAVNYCIQYSDQDETSCSKEYNCKAIFFNSDTLGISIGIGNGFGGIGFSIRYKESKFQIRPFWIVDAGPPYNLKEASLFEVVEEKLALNKINYKAGDSLFGKINFRLTETASGKQIEHSGEGYFRCKVDTLY